MSCEWTVSSLFFSTQEEGIARPPLPSKWRSRLGTSPWEVRLTNLQELLDELDILKKYFNIRIQDFYNEMLRTGWTLGSPQLMRVLQAVIWAYHRPTVKLLERHWKETSPIWWFRSCRTSIGPWARAFGARSRTSLCNDPYGHRRLSSPLLD